MAGLEIAGMALASADAIVQLLGAINCRRDAHREIPGLIDSAERRNSKNPENDVDVQHPRRACQSAWGRVWVSGGGL